MNDTKKEGVEKTSQCSMFMNDPCTCFRDCESCFDCLDMQKKLIAIKVEKAIKEERERIKKELSKINAYRNGNSVLINFMEVIKIVNPTKGGR